MIRVFFAALVGAGFLTVAVSSCTMMPGQREICANNIDDDMNGLVDCADPDCQGKPECFVDAGFFGKCAKCGQGCSRQEQCLQTSFFNDVPLPTCENSRCSALEANVSVDVILSAQQAWGTLISPTRSIATRFIKKTAIDGTPVTCSSVEAAAPGRTQVAVRQLEDSGKFLYQGIDIRPITQASGSIPLRFLNVTTGGNYLIWMEMWGGVPDGTTKFPTGNRLGFECFDGPAIGQSWPALTPNDNCVAPGQDAGTATCRQFQVTATRGPQP
ncbi:MAG: hypothetical protein SFW67_06010 [Myxococcaceae bacterium]|nr:hypothetical protein [Myxococcaceae bacterium]